MKIVVLCGGISTERDVSLISGKMIYEALKRNGHQVVLLDVYLGINEDIKDPFNSDYDWAKDIKNIDTINPDIREVKKKRVNPELGFFGPHVLEICREADVVYMGLHGEDGENGKIQAAFDLMDITYTGNDYVSSALAMNKAIAKELFVNNNIPTPKGIKLNINEKDKENTVPYPCIVKACSGGSSIGCSIANNNDEYKKALDEALKYDTEVVVEEFIKGREFSCGVIDGEALPVIEIAPKVGFYDYKNKYQAGSTIETCPADLSKEKTLEIQDVSVKVFKALRLNAYARMDFMMAENGNIYCLEANTLPGMTPMSLLPQEANAVGISFEGLCEKIINLAIKK